MQFSSIFSNSTGALDNLTQNFSYEDVDPQTAGVYALAAFATYAISSRLLSALKTQVLWSPWEGKSIKSTRLGEISEIRWQTPEGNVSLQIEGDNIVCTVEYPEQRAFRNPEIETTRGNADIPPHLLNSTPYEKLKYYSEFEVGINREGKPDFLKPAWCAHIFVKDILREKHPIYAKPTWEPNCDTIEFKTRAGGYSVYLEITKSDGKKIRVPQKNIFYLNQGYHPTRGRWNMKEGRRAPPPDLNRDVYPPQITSAKDLYKVSLFKPARIVDVSAQEQHKVRGGTNNPKPDLRVFFVPYNQPSILDKEVLISEFWWGISVICFDGCGGNHARIIVEGMDHGKHVIYMGHFDGPNVVEFEDWSDKNEIFFDKRSLVYKVKNFEAKKLLDRLLYESKNPPRSFSYFGRDGVFSMGNHNCYTWVVGVLHSYANIWLPSPLQPTLGFVLAKDYLYTEAEIRSRFNDRAYMLKV